MTTYHLPPRLAVVIPEDVDAQLVYLMRAPDGPPVVLQDVSAVIWLLAADGEDDVAAAVGEVVGRDRGQVETEVEKLLDDLIVRGLLTIRND
ncbi:MULTISPECIES: hypothetical protein [unclassified Knoellia]|uniref:hypothetical protein n=1 Tax=Knoellia altitudinis TaxID=3404795 RepID=UPI003612B000